VYATRFKVSPLAPSEFRESWGDCPGSFIGRKLCHLNQVFPQKISTESLHEKSFKFEYSHCCGVFGPNYSKCLVKHRDIFTFNLSKVLNMMMLWVKHHNWILWLMSLTYAPVSEFEIMFQKNVKDGEISRQP